MFTFKAKEKGTAFYQDGTLVGYALPAEGCSDHFIELEDGVYRWER